MLNSPEPQAPRPVAADGAFARIAMTLDFTGAWQLNKAGKLDGRTKHSLVTATRIRAARFPELIHARLKVRATVRDEQLDPQSLTPVAEAIAAGLLLAGVVQRRDQIEYAPIEVECRDVAPHLSMTIEQLP